MKKVLVAIAIACAAVVAIAGTGRAAKHRDQVWTAGAITVEGGGTLTVYAYNTRSKPADVTFALKFNSGFTGSNTHTTQIDPGELQWWDIECAAASSCLGMVNMTAPNGVIPSARYTVETSGTTLQTGHAFANDWRKIS